MKQTFNDLLATSVTQINNHFTIFHLNIRSLSRNLDNLQNLLSTVQQRFSVVGISETWLHQDQQNVNIDGYNFVHNYRPDRVRGGVGLYVANNFQFHLRPDLAIDNTNGAKTIFIEVINSNGSNLVVGVIQSVPEESDTIEINLLL